MDQTDFTAAKIFHNANRFIEAYYTVLQPICRETGLPPMAVDILMFLANNPDLPTAGDVCRCRGLKSGIVSVHVDRLVNEGLLRRQDVPCDRRKTQLVCTEAAEGIIAEGRERQRCFAQKLLEGLSEAEIEVFRSCLTVFDRNIEEIRRSGVSPKEQEKKPC